MLNFLWPQCLPEIKPIFCGFKRKNKKLILSKFWSRVNKLEVLDSESLFSSACSTAYRYKNAAFHLPQEVPLFLLTAG